MNRTFVVSIIILSVMISTGRPLFAGSCCTVADAKGAETQNTGIGSSVEAVYTCPMHPEVRSDKPGKCPKCGMDLVKVQTTVGGYGITNGGQTDAGQTAGKRNVTSSAKQSAKKGSASKKGAAR